MKASIGFIFFMLFLAGLAFVNLTNLQEQADTPLNSAADVEEIAWQATHIGEMRLPGETPIGIQFKNDNTLAGHAGCNRFSGEFALRAGTLTIGPLAVTRMACPEPANSFELSFLQALDQARVLLRVDSRLVMRDSQGVTVARFMATEDPGAGN